MAKDFKVKVFDGTERAETFMKVFGRTEVCVLSPLPVLVSVPGFDEPQSAYMLDLKEISDYEKARLIEHIYDTFKVDVMEIHKLLDKHGVPILAGECTLIIENPQMWIDIDDDDNDDDNDYWDDDYNAYENEWDDDDYDDWS